MAHLAAGARVVLAVDVDMGAGFRDELGPAIDRVADQVFHGRGSAGQIRRTGWKIADGADVLLELRGDRALDGPVTAVVHAGRDLIDQRAFRAGEEFDSEDANMVERLGDSQSDGARFVDLRSHGLAARDGRQVENAAAVLVLRTVPEAVATVRPAGDDDREFGGEVDRRL